MQKKTIRIFVMSPLGQYPEFHVRWEDFIILYKNRRKAVRLNFTIMSKTSIEEELSIYKKLERDNPDSDWCDEKILEQLKSESIIIKDNDNDNYLDIYVADDYINKVIVEEVVKVILKKDNLKFKWNKFKKGDVMVCPM